MSSRSWLQHLHFTLALTFASQRSAKVRIKSPYVAGMMLYLLTSASASANFLTVHGGPTYDQAAQTGYQNPRLPVTPGVTAGNGLAVGFAEKSIGGTSVGSRAVRWDASGVAATELGNLGTDSNGTTHSEANAINAGGVVVGFGEKYTGGTYFGVRAVRWDASGTAPTELGNLGTDSSGTLGHGIGYTASVAFANNNAGTTVGYAMKFTGGLYRGGRPVRWGAASTAATELAVLGVDEIGDGSAFPFAINSAGTAVGYSEQFSVDGAWIGYRAVRWSASGTAVTELGNLGTDSNGNTDSGAFAIDTVGTTVGYAAKYTGGTYLGTRAVRWDASGTAATELGNLGADSTGTTNSEAFAINTVGTAVGHARKYSTGGTDLGDRAVRWDASGTAATELGNLGTNVDGNTDSQAYAIDDAGIAVGYAEKYTGGTDNGRRAVLWGLDGIAIDLNTLVDPVSGWTLTEARAISDTNWVTGYGDFDPDGPGGQAAYGRMFLMQIPVSAPSGDYNHDGKVDAADYVVWRKSNGSQSDYNTWRLHFGQSAGSGAALPSAGSLSADVPEPATLVLLMFAALVGVSGEAAPCRKSFINSSRRDTGQEWTVFWYAASPRTIGSCAHMKNGPELLMQAERSSLPYLAAFALRHRHFHGEKILSESLGKKSDTKSVLRAR